MAVLGLQDKLEEVEIDLVWLDGTVVEDVVEAAERGPAPGHARTAHWFYSMPSPGVRYYHYEELLA